MNKLSHSIVPVAFMFGSLSSIGVRVSYFLESVTYKFARNHIVVSTGLIISFISLLISTAYPEFTIASSILNILPHLSIGLMFTLSLIAIISGHPIRKLKSQWMMWVVTCMIVGEILYKKKISFLIFDPVDIYHITLSFAILALCQVAKPSFTREELMKEK